MRAVNLLPREERNRRAVIGTQSLPAVVGAALGVVVTGVLAISFLGAAGDVRKAQDRLAQTEQELAATPAPPAPKPPPNAQLASEQNTRLLALSGALGGRIAWDRVLREFSLVLPGDVWLSTLSMAAPDPSGTTLDNFTMSGYTYSHDSVARLLSRLQLLPELTDVALASSTENPGKNGAPTTVQFTISAGVPNPVGTAAAAVPASATTPDTSATTTESGS